MAVILSEIVGYGDRSRIRAFAMKIVIHSEHCLVAPGNSFRHPGVRIIGKFKLKKEQKITAGLGQQGNDSYGP